MNADLEYQDGPQEQYAYSFQPSNYEVLWPEQSDPNVVYSTEFCDPNHLAFPQEMLPASTSASASEEKYIASNFFVAPTAGYSQQPQFGFQLAVPQPQLQSLAGPTSPFQGPNQKPPTRIGQPVIYTSLHSTKRQKISHPHATNTNDHTFGTAGAMERCYSQTGSQSTCCSSCSEGVPCAEPDCQLETAGACTECDGGIPRCNQPDCFDGGFGDQQFPTDHHLEEEARMSGWVNTAWTPQSPRTSSQHFSESMVDSSLLGFDDFDYHASLTSSLSPTSDVPIYPDPLSAGPVGELSGTGALFSSRDSSSSQPGSIIAATKDYTVHSCGWKDQNGVPCGQVRDDEGSLQLHVVKEHLFDLDKTSCYKCQWDGCTRLAKRGEAKSGFSQRGKLERHMATHTGYKCCQCKVCGKEFSAQQSLTQHMNLHEQIKPWKCKYCDKAFPQQSACTIHERTHTGDKPLKCEECGKQFSESSNLSKHRKTHGERGMHCCQFPGCTKSFHRLDQLRRHHAVHSKEMARASSTSPVKSESNFGSDIQG